MNKVSVERGYEREDVHVDSSDVGRQMRSDRGATGRVVSDLKLLKRHPSAGGVRSIAVSRRLRSARTSRVDSHLRDSSDEERRGRVRSVLLIGVCLENDTLAEKGLVELLVLFAVVGVETDRKRTSRRSATARNDASNQS